MMNIVQVKVFIVFLVLQAWNAEKIFGKVIE